MIDKDHDKAVSGQDNYAVFHAKVEDAKKLLLRRSTSLKHAHNLVLYMHDKHSESLNAWEERRIDLTIVMEDYSGEAEGYETLAGLFETAQNMEDSFRKSESRLRERLADVTATQSSVTTALAELDKVNEKLEMSRQESEARQRLDRVKTTNSTPVIVTAGADHSLHKEIAQARLAIASAEALVEIKESHRG